MKPILIDRRTFLRISSAAGAGLILGLPVRSKEASGATSAVLSPDSFVEITPEGSITIWITRQEMGQGVRTSLAMILADELDADWSAVTVRQAPLDARFGVQRTGGSLSIREMWEPLRRTGATARAMLVGAAAREWSALPATLKTAEGAVIDPTSGKTLRYGDLVEAAAKLPVPEDVPLKDPSEFRFIGRGRPQVDAHDIVTGRAIYGADVRLPGMLFASFERCPVVGGKLKTFDARAARRVPGVRSVFPLDGREHHWMLQWSNGVVVVADSTWAAMRGREALEIEWDEGPWADLAQDEILEAAKALLSIPGTTGRDDGDVDAVLDGADRTIEADYVAPYLSHSPMETMNAVADVRDDRCVIRAPCQFPNVARFIVQRVTGLPEDAIEVNITLIGGGFGRRIYADYAGEAALISREVKAPVQLLWTRIDDTRHGFYRPLSRHRFTARLDGEGRPVAWRHRVAGPSRNAVSGPDVEEPEESEISAANEMPYSVPNVRVEFNHHYVPLPCGPWRAVAYSQTGFVVESFIDELAHAAGRDPVAFRASLLDGESFLNEDKLVDPQRMKRILEYAAAKAGWGERSLPPGIGRGVAVTGDHGSFIAHIAEVSVKEGIVRVQRMITAVDCGTVVNPNGVEAQVEGAIALALSATLKGEITIRRGRVEQSSYSDYDVIRIDEMPRVEVHILPSDEPPGGMGEPPLPGVAPAVLNAIHAATGKRVRRIPVRREDLE